MNTILVDLREAFNITDTDRKLANMSLAKQLKSL